MSLFRVTQRLFKAPIATRTISSLTARTNAVSCKRWMSSIPSKPLETPIAPKPFETPIARSPADLANETRVAPKPFETPIAPKPLETPIPIARSPADLANETRVAKQPVIPQPAMEGGRRYVVLTTAGPDRVGIVHNLSAHLRALHANIEESRMTVLGNDFAIILLLSLPNEVPLTVFRDEIQSRFPDFLVAARSTHQASFLNQRVKKVLQLTLEGPDQLGIVESLTKILAKHEISIRSLDTDTGTAPFAGYATFHLRALIVIPQGVSLDNFAEEMHSYEEEYGLEISMADPSEEDMDENMDEDEDESPSMRRRIEEDEDEEEDDHPRVRRQLAPTPLKPSIRTAPTQPTRPAQPTPTPRRRV